MATAVLIFMGLLLALELASVAMLVANYLSTPAPGRRRDPAPLTDPPLISILVPARNEERNIRACVEGLFAQDYPRFEVIVSDDRSEDRTPRILMELQRQYPALKVIHPPAPPPEWISAKSHALWHAYQVAQGDWLLFVDADSRLFPWAVSEATRYGIESRADLFSALPGTDCVGFWEKTIIPVLGKLFMTFTPLWKVKDLRSKVVIGTGPFMMFRRGAYLEIGGHEAVKGERVEDVELARIVKSRGLQLRFAFGWFLGHTRHYTSLGEIFRAVTRQYFLGLGGNPLLAVAGIAFALLLTVVPWVALVGYGALWVQSSGSFGQGIGMLLAACQITAIIAGHYMIGAFYHVRVGPALLHPLGGLMVAAIMVKSTLDGLRGKAVSWRGRPC